jgi:hypothetical protein
MIDAAVVGCLVCDAGIFVPVDRSNGEWLCSRHSGTGDAEEYANRAKEQP